MSLALLRQQLAELRSATGSNPVITATLLARSKAAGARALSPRLDGPPRRAADTVAEDAGPAAGPAAGPEEAAASRDE